MGGGCPGQLYRGEGGGERSVVHGVVESVWRISKTWSVLVVYDYRRLSLPAAGKGGRVRTIR